MSDPKSAARLDRAIDRLAEATAATDARMLDAVLALTALTAPGGGTVAAANHVAWIAEQALERQRALSAQLERDPENRESWLRPMIRHERRLARLVDELTPPDAAALLGPERLSGATRDR